MVEAPRARLPSGPVRRSLVHGRIDEFRIQGRGKSASTVLRLRVMSRSQSGGLRKEDVALQGKWERFVGVQEIGAGRFLDNMVLERGRA